MNVFSFNGNLGRDVTTNNVNGTAVANFVVAVKSGFGQNEQTLWVDCALWGQRAEGGLINYLTKGQQVCVTGELGSREYDSNGETRTALTCRVNDVTLVGGKPEGGQQQPQAQQPRQYQQPQQAPAGGMNDFSSDIPF